MGMVEKKLFFHPTFGAVIILYCLKMQAHILLLTHMHVRMLRMLLCGREKKHNFGEYFVNLKYRYILSILFILICAYSITRKKNPSETFLLHFFLSVGAQKLLFIFPFRHELFFKTFIIAVTYFFLIFFPSLISSRM